MVDRPCILNQKSSVLLLPTNISSGNCCECNVIKKSDGHTKDRRIVDSSIKKHVNKNEDNILILASNQSPTTNSNVFDRLRKEFVFDIILVLPLHLSNFPREKKQQIAEKIEKVLFKQAKSLEVYSDISTLRQRVSQLAERELKSRQYVTKKRTSTIDDPIEIATSLIHKQSSLDSHGATQDTPSNEPL